MSRKALKLSGLVPVWEFAVCAGVEEAGLIQSLKRAGVPLLEIFVSGRNAAFAQAADLTAFIYKNASPVGCGDDKADIVSPSNESQMARPSDQLLGQPPGEKQ